MFSIASSSLSPSHPPSTLSGTWVGASEVFGLMGLNNFVRCRSFPPFDKRKWAHVLWVSLILAEVASSNDSEGVEGEDMVNEI